MSDTFDVPEATSGGALGGLGALSSLYGPQGSPFPQLRSAASALIPDLSQLGPTLDASQKAKSDAIDRAIQRLTEAQGSNKAGVLAALASGFLAPTRAGSFAESFGSAMGQAAPQINMLDKQRLEQGNLVDQLRVQQAQLPADSLMKRLSLAGTLNRFAGNSSSRSVVQDPNSPTGWSYAQVTSDGQEVGKIVGAPPPRSANATNYPTTPDGVQVVDHKTWSQLLGKANTAIDQAVKNGEVDISDEAGRNNWLKRWIATNALAAPPGTDVTKEYFPSIHGTRPGKAPEVAPAAPAGTDPAALATPADNPILKPLPPRQGAVRPGVIDDLKKYSDSSRDYADAASILADSRKINPLAWYGGIPGVAGAGASLAPETAASVHKYLDPKNPGATATARLASNLNRLTLSLAKPLLGGQLSDRDLDLIAKMNGAVKMPPQERENLFSQGEWLVRKKMAWNDLASSYIAHGKAPPSFVEWDKAYEAANPYPGAILAGETPSSPVVRQAQPPTSPGGQPAQVPANLVQPVRPPDWWVQKLSPEERTLLLQGRGRRSQPGYTLTPEEIALREKIRKIQSEDK